MRPVLKHVLAMPAILLVAACAQSVPDSGAGVGPGVGFGDYAAYEVDRARREAAGGTAALPAPVPVAATPIGAPVPAPPPPGGISTSALAAAGIPVAAPSAAPTLGAPAPAFGATAGFGAPGPVAAPAPTSGALVPVTSATTPAGVAPDMLRGGVEASPSNAAPQLVGVASAPAPNATGISDEQDFAAVSSRESIESDAARRQAQAAQYQVIQPQALPPPPANAGPNIVQYALSAPNAKGQAYYSRFAFAREGRMQRNCASYSSSDEAQIDFLARGGPERDSRGLDPDGDGFACAWDPAPFRAAVGG